MNPRGKVFQEFLRPDPKIPPPATNSPSSDTPPHGCRGVFTNQNGIGRRLSFKPNTGNDHDSQISQSLNRRRHAVDADDAHPRGLLRPHRLEPGDLLGQSDAVPLEWELKRARQMVAELQPEIRDAARQIAREKVQVARLERQLGDADESLVRSEQDIRRLRDDLATDRDRFEYAGRTYTVSQVKSADGPVSDSRA